MDKGFEFNVIFNKELDEFQQDKLWNDFVNFIEENKISWGGGHDSNYIKGYLDCSNSNLDIPELVKKIFEYFYNLKFLKTIEIVYPMLEEYPDV